MIGGSILAFFLLITSIIWIPLLIILSIPAGLVYLLLKYTHLGHIGNKAYYYSIKKVLFFNGVMTTWFWKWFYDTFAKRHTKKDVTLMNYGYADFSSDGIFLDKIKDTKEVLMIQLYHYAVFMHAQLHELKDKTLLEIGVGRGGGFNYIVNKLKPSKAIGVDISHGNIEFCRHTYQELKNAEFLLADANKLEECKHLSVHKGVDVVVNIQSSHCYYDMDRFFH